MSLVKLYYGWYMLLIRARTSSIKIFWLIFNVNFLIVVVIALCREACIFLHSTMGACIRVPFSNGKCLVSINMIRGKLGTTSGINVEALLEIGGEYEPICPLHLYAGIGDEAYFILEHSLSSVYIAKSENYFETPEQGPSTIFSPGSQKSTPM